MDRMRDALWRIYQRPERPVAWESGGNLPWDDPEFSTRMLREHLDESHGAASRVEAERMAQIEWLWHKLALEPDRHILDITCGPGLYAVALAQQGCQVTGIDFGPASIEYAEAHAANHNLAERCHFSQQDVREMDFPDHDFQAALLLYGQLAVFTKEEAQAILNQAASSLGKGGRLCIELLDPAHIDKSDSNWWYSDDNGLWGDAPYLHLGERFWDAENEISVERYQILHIETGELTEVQLCDQLYRPEHMLEMLKGAGFDQVDVYPAWDGLPLYDNSEWIVYVATKLDE